MKVSNTLGAVASLVTVLFIIAVVVYLFNMQHDGPVNRGFAQMVAADNEDSPDIDYKLSDEYALNVYYYDSVPQYPVVIKYKRAMMPFCLLCGWNAPAGTAVYDPHVEGDYVFSGSPLSRDTDVGSEGMYTVLNLKTNELKAINSLDEMGLDTTATNHFDLTNLEERYDVLSMEKESCLIMMMAFAFIYFCLAIWAVIDIIRLRKA